MKANCIAITKIGVRCSNPQKFGEYCGMHKPKDKNLQGDNMIKEAITITFSDVCENGVEMQKLGQLNDRGLSLEELTNAKNYFEKLGVVCELIDLGLAIDDNLKSDKTLCYEPAYVLVIRNGADCLLKDINKTHQDMMTEQKSLTWDKTVYSRKHKNNGKGGVVNKLARWNLCYADESQNPNIAEGKGTVVAFKDIECTNTIRQKLSTLLGPIANNLFAEGNYYYDTSKCGIGYHNDLERKVVIAVRLGNSFPLHFVWYLRHKPIGDVVKLNLDAGDMYMMSAKTVGNDGLKSSILTLKHSAGAEKYLVVKK